MRSFLSKLTATVALVAAVVVGATGSPAGAKPAHSAQTSVGATTVHANDWWA